MKPFKHILVPTDFEASSSEAIEVAMNLAQAFDSKLTLVHVWEVPVYPYMEFLTTELITSLEQAATERMAKALENVRKVVPNAESMLKTGVAWDGILHAIQETKPDLVVMGTHGRRGVRHVVLGSVAEKVLRLASVPVLTVPGRRAS